MTRLRWTIGLSIWGLFGVILGALVQVVVIENSPPVYESNAKLIIGARHNLAESKDRCCWGPETDPITTAIETIECTEMARKTIERLNVLHPEVPSAPVTIRSRTTPGSAIITIRGVSTNDLYLSHYLNGLLDEYVAFTRSVDQERSQRVLKSFLQAVVETQGTMEMASKELQALRKASESISVRIELERLPDRLKRLRNERDDLRLLPTSKLPAIEAEVQYIESQLDEYEAAASKTKIATERFESARKAYSKLFEHSETFQQMLSPCGDYIVVMERATYPIKLSASRLIGIAYPTFGGFFGFLIACFRLKYPQARLGSTQ